MTYSVNPSPMRAKGLTPKPDAAKSWCPVHAIGASYKGWDCPKCPTDLAPNRALSREAGCAGADLTRPTPAIPQPTKAARKCVLGHVHRGHGERVACPIVHAAAAHAGLETFITGSPGLACFCLAPNEQGRPVYVSIDWILTRNGKVVAGLDWKGETTHSAMYGHGDGFARTKRIFESETGAKVYELKVVGDIEKAIESAHAEGGRDA